MTQLDREVNGTTSSEPRGAAAVATPTLGTKPAAEGVESSTSAALSRDDLSDPLSSLRRELGLQENDGRVNIQVSYTCTNRLSFETEKKFIFMIPIIPLIVLHDIIVGCSWVKLVIHSRHYRNNYNKIHNTESFTMHL